MQRLTLRLSIQYIILTEVNAIFYSMITRLKYIDVCKTAMPYKCIKGVNSRMCRKFIGSNKNEREKKKKKKSNKKKYSEDKARANISPYSCIDV